MSTTQAQEPTIRVMPDHRDDHERPPPHSEGLSIIPLPLIADLLEGSAVGPSSCRKVHTSLSIGCPGSPRGIIRATRGVKVLIDHTWNSRMGTASVRYE